MPCQRNESSLIPKKDWAPVKALEYIEVFNGTITSPGSLGGKDGICFYDSVTGWFYHHTPRQPT